MHRFSRNKKYRYLVHFISGLDQEHSRSIIESRKPFHSLKDIEYLENLRDSQSIVVSYQLMN